MEEKAEVDLTTISESVPLPIILDQRRHMTDFADELRRCRYDLASCAERFGVFPRLGVNFWRALRPDWNPRYQDPVDTLLELFIEGNPVAVDQLRAHFSSAFVDNAVEMRLAEKNGRFLESKVCLFPCYGKYVVTDRAAKNTSINQVMWLWGESFLLGGLVKRSQCRRATDLGTGSGVHAILASGHCREIVAVDINPRAIEFAKFNGALNGIDNIEFVLSDVFNSVESTCDLLVANPPYAPDSAARAGDNFWSGGVEGTDILRRIVEAIPTRLDADGTCHLIALYPNPRGTTIRNHFDRWLGGTLRCYEVLDYTWPVPHYQDLLSEKPFNGDKSAWRFGVVSLRRSRSSSGWWKEVAGKGVFFREDGSCSAVADHGAV
jgi:methylase of polypeptide subunit release factors